MIILELTDEFTNALGQWPNYDNYQVADRTTIQGQKHVDIRSFYLAETTPQTVFQLSVQDVGDLNSETMSELSGNLTVRPAEPWTGGDASVERWPTRSNFNLLSATLSAGINTFSSVTPEAPVDLLTGFEDSDHFSIALPSFPLTLVNLTTSFIDLTSHPNGDFAAGPTASVTLDTSSVGLVAGMSEFRVSRSALNQNGIDLSKVTGVRFRIDATGASATKEFKVMAIRLLAKTWTHTTLDYDTRTGRVRKTPPRNGDHTVPGGAWPIMWRANEPSGQDDPRPIDAEMGVVFNPGFISTTGSFTLYFREVTEDFLTQLDLNGITMAELQGHDQPDLGNAMYNPRLQTDLDNFTQEELAAQQQFSLERTPDYLSASWVQFTCQWSPGGGTVSIIDTEGNGYTFNIVGGLSNSQTYVFYATLEENSARATIYTIDASGRVGTKVFDSTTVLDDTAYKRRKGRFGWHADLRDGNGWIDSIRTRRASYAEYRSLPYDSDTPVVGAELFVSTSPPLELFTSFAPGPYNITTSTVERDSQRALSGSSWRFSTDGSEAMQGLQTNSFLLNDFDNSVIKFDLFFPSTAEGDLKIFLADTSGIRIIELLLPPLIRDQWQTVKIGLPFDQTEVTGRYRLLFLQTSPGAATWWIDNPTIYTRTVAWDGRAVVDDPWHSNDARWTPFYDNSNSENGGILFPRRGSQLQVRARALRKGAHVDRIQFKPRYAELGRFTYATTDRPRVVGTPSFSTSSLGSQRVRFTGTATFSQAAYAANFEWNFGDGGVGIGQIVDHQYPAAGVYTVTLVVTDNFGNQSNYVNTVVA